MNIKNKKLFKKLNEQMEINSIELTEPTDEEKAEAEEKIIFGDANSERLSDLEIENDMTDENL